MRDLDATVGVYADQMVVERGMIDLPKDDAVGDDRLTEQLVGIGHDVGRVQQMIIWQPAERIGDAVQHGAAAGRRRTRREPRAHQRDEARQIMPPARSATSQSRRA